MSQGRHASTQAVHLKNFSAPRQVPAIFEEQNACERNRVIHIPEELMVKFPVQNLFASRTLAACVAIAASVISAAALAQSTPSSEQPSRASIRKANFRLEHNVRTAITRAKIPDADIRIVARGGKVTLDGTVPDQAMVQPAATAAGTVAGVTSVQTLLTMREAGH
jgi:hyperosmotically inducible periplasmic protein